MYQSRNQYLNMTITLVLLGIISMACDRSGSVNETLPTWTPTNIVASYTPQLSKAKLAPPECVGLFVSMQDKTIGKPGQHVAMQTVDSNGLVFEPRVYIFSSTEPIIVITAILVIGSGQLGVQQSHPLNDFSIEIVNDEGKVIPFTDENFNSPYGSGSYRGNIVDHNAPLIETFRIDEWFDLSNSGLYTMTLTREIWDGNNELLSITGNAVMFAIDW